MIPDELQTIDFISRTIASAVRELLETKHLYQSVEIPVKAFDDFIKSAVEECRKEIARSEMGISSGRPAAIAHEFSDQLRNCGTSALNSPWNLSLKNELPPLYVRQTGPKPLNLFLLPTVRISCAQCDAVKPPHNPGYVGLTVDSTTVLTMNNGAIQVFALPYQCQSCKCEPLFFLVRREGLRLTLVGRSQFQEISVPDFIPKYQRKFYRNAIIADQTSFTLAAALYLRSLIEQYFYQTIPETDIKAIRGNPTGDELAELYAKTLPKSFPDNFPSLKKAYDDLSKIIHSGKEGDDTKQSFVAIRSAVDGHFKAIQIFKEMPVQ
jgi:hypothetical protein